jgi:uncharacterized SAM-binding protein YcdF (DUF218 family)
MPHRRSLPGSIALAVVVSVVVCWVSSLCAVLYWASRDEMRPAGAIVVLGAAQYVGRPSPVLRARLDHAVKLWKQRVAPQLIVTGGQGTGDTTTEAAVSKRYAEQRGVPEAAILLESRGRTSSQSMAGVAALMRAQRRRDVVLVSDPFHMLRLIIIARRHGLEPYGSPTPTSPIAASRAERWKYTLSESVKVPFTLLFEHGSGDHE